VNLLVEIALGAAAAIAAAVCVAILPQTTPVGRRTRVEPAPSRPEQLVRLERLVISAGASSLQLHAYLRPLLVEVASQRLAGRGRALERMTADDARELLGDRMWEIVRPDRPFPEDRSGPGITPCELADIIDRLERL
jgi:hypothetical protein